MSTFGIILPFVPMLRMTLYPKKVKPSVIWVTLVLSSDNVSPRVLRRSFSSSFMARASAFVPLQSTTKSRVKEWLSDRRQGLSVAAGFPWQCLTNLLIVGSPFPSHPTVRSVFPSTAVRQSSSHIMRRFRCVLEHAAANVGEPHRIELAVRKAFPPETPAFTALGQVPAKTDVHETLKPAKSLAGVRVSEIVRPSRHDRIHHLHEFLRAYRCSSRREVLQAVPNLLLSRLGWKSVDGVLPATGTLAFHEVETDEIKPIDHPGHASLVAAQGQVHPLGDRFKGGASRLGASAAYQDGIISVAVQRGTKLRWVAATMPQLIEQVQVDIAIQRGDWGALRHSDLRWHDLSLLAHPDLQRLFDQPQETAIGNPLGDQRHKLAVRDAGEVRLEVDLYDTPGPVVQVCSNREGRLLGIPLRPVAVGAVVKIRLKNRLHDEPHRFLYCYIFHRGNAERPCAPFGFGYLDHSHGRELVALLA